MSKTNSETLVAYFSRTGEQYGVGVINEGNTSIVAKIIAEKTGADLFEIKVVDDNYPDTYSALIQYAKKEKQENARPEIIGKVDNIKKYKNIFIGYPNWWGDMPMPVHTFIENHKLTDKNIYNFCTHEGSGGIKSDDFAIYGHIAQTDKDLTERQISQWLKRLGF